jgi:asparagine N-glycosylation enzyme membrane subunit Stt3
VKNIRTIKSRIINFICAVILIVPATILIFYIVPFFGGHGSSVAFTFAIALSICGIILLLSSVIYLLDAFENIWGR